MTLKFHLSFVVCMPTVIVKCLISIPLYFLFPPCHCAHYHCDLPCCIKAFSELTRIDRKTDTKIDRSLVNTANMEMPMACPGTSVYRSTCINLMDAFFQRKFDILHLCFFQYKIFERKEKNYQRLKFSETSFNIKLNEHFEDTAAPK